jgi:redox-sensitive bicupin YhaK (pirin superfamily)
LLKNGGPLEGFQIWINLPKVSKMIPPKYQDVPSAKIPVSRIVDGHEGSTVKIISGEYNNLLGACTTVHPVGVLDVRIQPGDTFVLPTNPNHVVHIYVYRGSALFGQNGVVMSHGQGSTMTSGDEIRITVPQSAPLVNVPAPHVLNSSVHNQAGVAFLVLSGQPINEPLARSGPFVMNTDEEIRQCYADYRSGKMAAESRHSEL